MKKLLLVLGIIAFATSLSFAATQGAASGNQPTAHKAAVNPGKHVSGTISSLEQADPVKGLKAKLVLTATEGKSETFIVLPATPVTGGGKNSSFNNLAIGEKVSVQYRVLKDNEKEAVAIHLMK
jgi:hypothetical protein